LFYLQAPEITNLPTAGSISEAQEDEILLFGLTTSEDATSCDQVAPVQDEFIVKFEPTTSRTFFCVCVFVLFIRLYAYTAYEFILGFWPIEVLVGSYISYVYVLLMFNYCWL